MKTKWLLFGIVVILAALGMTALVPVAADSPTVESVQVAPVAVEPETVMVMIMEQAPADTPADGGETVIIDPVLGTPVPEDNPTSEPTAESTSEPGVVIINNPPAEPTPAETGINWASVFYAAVTAILGGGTIGAILARFGSNKAGLDSAEKLYQGLSPDSQAMFRGMFEKVNELALKVLDLADKITDGQPNDSPAAQAAKRYKQDVSPTGDEGSEFKG